MLGSRFRKASILPPGVKAGWLAFARSSCIALRQIHDIDIVSLPDGVIAGKGDLPLPSGRWAELAGAGYRGVGGLL